MTNEQLHANRKCPYGGGCKDCPCDGKCAYAPVVDRINQQPTMTERMLFAERSERLERGD